MTSEFPLSRRVKTVATKEALRYIDRSSSIPGYVLSLITDDTQTYSWRRFDDPLLSDELSNWDDVFVIAPLSLNILSKIAWGFCDTPLPCLVRSWDCKGKGLIVAPDIDPAKWESKLVQSPSELTNFRSPC